jgi:hypothetical protein
MDALVLGGMDSVNISLDSLVPAKFELITRRKGFERFTHSCLISHTCLSDTHMSVSRDTHKWLDTARQGGIGETHTCLNTWLIAGRHK